MEKTITRDEALALLRQYNKEPFHLQHALTVEAVMRWFANDLGYGEEADFWAMCGLLHDIDFEMWPEQHCLKAPELLRPAGVGEQMIHAICSHGHKICTDVSPEKEMEKVLFACDANPRPAVRRQTKFPSRLPTRDCAIARSLASYET